MSGLGIVRASDFARKMFSGFQFGQGSEMKGRFNMKKLMFAAAVVAAGVACADVTSANVVGYNSMETVEGDTTFGVATFEAVAGSEKDAPTFTLSQVSIGDADFAYYNYDYIATIDPYGAQDKYYSWDPFTDGGTWIETDETATPGDPVGDLAFPVNQAFWVRSEYGNPLIFSGAVLAGDTEIYSVAGDMAYSGNFTPATITLGDIVVGAEDFAYYNYDYIATINPYGAQDKYYSWDPFTDGGTWIETDETATPGDPANDVEITANMAFIFRTEFGAALNIPSPIKK